MRASDRLGVAVMVAMTLALPALQPVTSDGRLFLDAFVMIVVVGVTGIVARRLLPTDRGARLVQTLVAATALVGLALAGGVSTNPFRLPELLAGALRWTVESTAPMGPNLGVRVVAVAAVTLLALVADQLTVSVNQPAWSLLPLGVLYLVPALALPALVSFWSVLWLGYGYLLVLLADSANRTRLLQFKGTDRAAWGGLLLGGTVSLLASLVVAALAGVLTPGLDPTRGAPFTGSGPVQMGDPSLDLRRNLQQPVDRRVITYTSSRDTGSYLRMTSLPGFDVTGFHLNAIDLFSGSLPAPEGASAGRPRFTVDVTIGDFNAEWLPLPYAPTAFQASGDWRHDPVSLSVLAAGAQQKRATNGLSYSATVVDVNPSAAELAKAVAGRPRDVEVTGALPAGFPEQIVQLARDVTAEGDTDGERAVLLQDWLRSSVFTYSTEPAPGSGFEALTGFLLVDRTGYCEQFAASMAVMARALGIPARVAIGFLPGRKVGEQWQVNIRDMHTWPELYFAGLGWVSFEPTPGVATAPRYTGATVDDPAASPSPSPTPTDSTASAEPSDEPSEAPLDEDQSEQAAPLDLWWLAWLGGGLAVLALAAAPTLIRSARRRRRLAAHGPPRQAVGAAWDEVRDSIWDAGREWPHGSARQIGDEVARTLPDEAAAAMGRVAVLVEQSRYADTLDETVTLPDDVQLVREAVATAGRQTWWSRLLPRSLWRGLWWRG